MKGKKLTIVLAVMLAVVVCTAIGCAGKQTECVHTGGTATCTEQATCEQCGEKYGPLAEHKLGEWQTDGAEHWKECSVCHGKIDKAAHDGGTATCTEQAECSICHVKYGALGEHNYESEHDDAQHWTECSVCHDTTAKQDHTGGTATCTEQAECSICHVKYGALGEHNYESEHDETQHWTECSVCHDTTEKKDHTGGVATCTEQATCTQCGEKYGSLAEHKLGEWQTDGTEHWKECSVCHGKIDKAAHDGGVATCTEKAECSICHVKYGELGEHNYESEHDETQHWTECSVCHDMTAKQDHTGGTATCTEKAECSICHVKYGELGEHNYENEHDETQHWTECSVCHDMTAKQDHTGGVATCTEKAICEQCGKKYGSLAAHAFDEFGKCTVCGASAYKFEAAKASVAAGSKGMPGKNEREGIMVVWHLKGNEGAKVTFTVYSEFNKKAKMIVAFAPLAVDTKITDIFDITVNGTLITSDATVKGYGDTATQLSVETILGEIDMRDGADDNSNVIEFTVKTDTDGFEIFDYIKLETVDCELSAEYMAPTPAGHTHTYAEEWTYNDEYHWHAGNCDHTFKKKDYAKHEFDVNNVCVDCGYTRSFKYEAEWGKLGQGNGGKKPTVNNNAIVGELNNNTGASISFAVYSPEASTQRLYVYITRRKDLKFGDGFALFVNRQEITTVAYNNAKFIAPTNGSAIDWAEYGEVDLGEIALNKGVNYIMLVVKAKGENQGNIDYFKFQGTALVSRADKEIYDGQELIYEAEFAELTGGAFIGKPCTAKDENDYKSPLVDGLHSNIGRSVKFTVNSDKVRKVKLLAAVIIRDKDIKFNSFFNVYLNTEITGVPISIADGVMIPKGSSNEWFASREVEIGEIELVSGDNTIEFYTIGTEGCNFDYIKLVPVE